MRICKLGEDVLRQKCVSVESNEINDELRATLNEMFETKTKLLEDSNKIILTFPSNSTAILSIKTTSL